MHLRRLSVGDFRNYSQAELLLAPGVTCLIGPNGHGKTNLVEAIGYLSHLGSHRVSQDAPLVRVGTSRAIIRATVMHHGRATELDVEINPGRANRARVHGALLPRPRELLGRLRTVLFAPEDLALVKGDPAARRRFIDELLVQRQPRWAGVRQDYERIVKQRTALLKLLRADHQATSTAASADSLTVWDAHLAEVGAQLTYARLRLLHDLRTQLSAVYGQICASATAVGAEYQAHLGDDLNRRVAGGEVPAIAELRDGLLQRLAHLAKAEKERGVCLVGPHRDEVALALGETPAKGYASQGESWSLALALRLASFAVLRKDLGDDPVLILDDVFAELDQVRRTRLAHALVDAEQVLITSAVAEDVPTELSGTMRQVALNELVTGAAADGENDHDG